MPKQHTIEEMQTQIRQLKTTIALPGVPADEIAIYTATIQRIEAEIQARQQSGPVTPKPAPPPTEQIKHNTPPPPPPLYVSPPIGGRDAGVVDTIEQAFDRDADRANAHYQQQAAQPLKPRTIHAGATPTTTNPNNATLEADHQTDPHNPRIILRWADGYFITCDETAARGRFLSTLRDTLALKCVAKEHRYEKMWRWDSPWRAAGYYQALTYFYGGPPPTLQQLGITRPTGLQTTIFQLITEKAAQLQP